MQADDEDRVAAVSTSTGAPWTFSARLLDFLRCPQCGGELRSPASDGLVCERGHRFPVVRGIPRFVPDDSYAGNFGYEWSVFSRTQLDGADRPRHWRRDLYGHGEVGADEESRRTFALKTGLEARDVANKLVLDAGCGMGRFLDVCSSMGAHVVGADLTAAIDSAARNLAGRANVDLVQADLRTLPFADGSFDVVYSIGVLHHTPDTQDSFRRLVRMVRPGGTIAIWVYERAPWRRPWLPPAQAFSDLYRTVTTRLPNDVLLRLCRARAALDERVRGPQLQRVLKKLLPASDHPDLEWRTLDNFDWYSPRYQWKHTFDEVRGWFEDVGLTEIRALDVPVAVQGRRPG